MQISVLLCTHNARAEFLRETLRSLRAQSLPMEKWELIVIDNTSAPPVARELVAWHPRGRVVREETLGLSRARARGIDEAAGELLVFCDDDNLLGPDYLQAALDLFSTGPDLGAAGGKSLPRYLGPVPDWFRPFVDRLAVRDLGSAERIVSWKKVGEAERSFPSCAPIGAGMVLRREIGLAYARQSEFFCAIPDRVGRALSSGGDGAMVLAALHAGAEVGYFPALELIHLIPKERLRLGYLARLNRASSESWVRLLAQHGICPWPAIPASTVRLRQLRAFFAQQAWRGRARYFQWAGACGIFSGQAQIGRKEARKIHG